MVCSQTWWSLASIKRIRGTLNLSLKLELYFNLLLRLLAMALFGTLIRNDLWAPDALWCFSFLMQIVHQNWLKSKIWIWRIIWLLACKKILSSLVWDIMQYLLWKKKKKNGKFWIYELKNVMQIFRNVLDAKLHKTKQRNAKLCGSQRLWFKIFWMEPWPAYLHTFKRDSSESIF